MGRCKILFFFVFVFVSSLAFGQKDRYAVFLSDKDKVAYSIDQPEVFLSQRAIDRRERMGIEITDMDFPVDMDYITQVKETGAEVYFSSKWFNALIVQMTESQRVSVQSLSFVDSVVFIALGERLLKTTSVPTIASTFKPPSKVNASTKTQLRLIDVDEMHKDGFNGEGVLIAVFDDGFQGVNEFEPFGSLHKENRLVATKDFITNSGNVFQFDDHGSSVLSCIAADYGDELRGTAPKASFILCVTEDKTDEYRIEEYNWLLAAEFADSAGVDVINGSLGYSTFSSIDSRPSMSYSLKDMDGKTTVVARAATMASDRGIVVVVSAGNEGNGSWGHMTSPGDVENILTIGSVNSSGVRSSFSSYGPTADGRIKPDVVALGSSATIFYMSSGDGVIESGNGTSFSSPMMAGFAANLIQAYPTWSNTRVMEAIRATGNRSTVPDTLLGYGVPQYPLKEYNNVLATIEDEMVIYPNPFDEDIITIDFGNMVFDRTLYIQLYDMYGKELYLKEVSPKDFSSKLDLEFPDLGSAVYLLSLRSRKFKKTKQLKKL